LGMGTFGNEINILIYCVFFSTFPQVGNMLE